MMFMVNSLADVVLAEGAEAMRLPLRAFLGGFSSIVAHSMLVEKTGAARKALRLAASVAEEVEREATPDVKVAWRIAYRRHPN